MPHDPLHQLVTCLARALQSEQRQRSTAAGMPTVHWQLLNYLQAANRYSNTPQAMTDYLGLTKGTVSQSLKLLESRGWITRQGDARDRRVMRFFLTPEGAALIAEDPGDATWDQALAALPAADRESAAATLGRLLRGWQQGRDGLTFGVCRSCEHFRRQSGNDGQRCGLTGEPLSDADATRICREHKQPA